MRAVDNPEFHSTYGAQLYVGNSNTVDSSGVSSWDAANGDGNSEWLQLSERNGRGSFELVWTGAFTAEVYLHGSNGGPGQRLTLDETIVGPNALNVFTGDVSKAPGAALEAEDIGCALINVGNLGMSRLRLALANTVGTGSWKARYRAMGGA